MHDRELMELDRAGFIPGPEETEEDFLARVEKTKAKFERGHWIPPAHWEWARESLDRLFNVKPLYICAFYSNRSLTPWQGAASWIEGRSLSSIQLRKALQKGSYLGLYQREEILAHEAVHAARSGFDEERCEEFFAYMTAEKRWRRLFGPIIQRPWEVWPLLICLCAGAVSPFFFWGATLWMGWGFARLIRQHDRLRRAAQHILNRVKNERLTRAVLFRLTDREIDAFAAGENIETYAQQQHDLRWRVIKNYLQEEGYGTKDQCGR